MTLVACDLPDTYRTHDPHLTAFNAQWTQVHTGTCALVPIHMWPNAAM